MLLNAYNIVGHAIHANFFIYKFISVYDLYNCRKAHFDKIINFLTKNETEKRKKKGKKKVLGTRVSYNARCVLISHLCVTRSVDVYKQVYSIIIK